MILPRILYSLGAIVLICYVLVVARAVMIPIVIALFVWYLINAVAKTYGQVYPPMPGWVRFTLAVASLLFFIWIPIQLTSSTIPEVRASVPRYQTNLRYLIDSTLAYFGVEKAPSIATVAREINLNVIVSDLASVLAAVTGNAVLILLYVVFLLAEQASFPKKLEMIFTHSKANDRVRAVLHSIADRVRTYLVVKTAVSLLTGAISYLILRLMEVDFAEFWAVIIFFLNFIPNIGSILGVAFPTILTMIQYTSFTPGLIVAATAGVAQFSIGNLLEPRLMGSSLNLSPLVIIISLVVWGSMWGIVGAFLAVPLMVVLAIVLAEFEDTRPIAVLLSADGRV